jgi:uncharacterized protein (TIGR01777 family)
MKVLVGGATGLIGSALARQLKEQGHDVLSLTRNPGGAADAVGWDPEKKSIDAEKLPDVDAVVNLAGDNIGKGRWSADKKKRIRESRVDATAFLVQTLKKLETRPRVFITASAIGFYGDRGDEVLREDSAPGEGFLAEICRDWEAAAATLASEETRVNMARFGIVLSTQGGALKEMLTPFKLGAGGVIGGGDQYYSWIAIDDAVGALAHILSDVDEPGPVNIVSPNPATNRDFTKALGKVLNRPTVAPMPKFAARLAFGKEKADELLLASARVEPARLLETGYIYKYPELHGALEHVIRSRC